MRSISLFVVLLCLGGCTSWEYPQSFPLVLTESVGTVSSDGAIFNGRIETLGEGHIIISHGFVWDVSELPTLNSFHSSVAGEAEPGQYSSFVAHDLLPGRLYHVRSYVQTDKVVVYGNDVSFTSLGSSAPVIEDFEPKEGGLETEVTITGRNFSSRVQNNIVKLGTLSCEVVAGTDSTLVVRLPQSILPGLAAFSVSVYGKSTLAETEFEVTDIGGVKIFSLSTRSGRVGDFVAAHGEGFDVSGSFPPTVQLGGMNSRATILAADQMEFPIPDYLGTAPIFFFIYIGELQHLFDDVGNFTVVNSWNTVSESSPLDNFYGYSSTVVGNSIFVMGGKTLYEYNTSARTWTKKADFPGNYRFFGSAFTYDSKVFYGFGDGYYEANHADNNEHYSDLWSYDPSTDQWELTSTSTYVALETLVTFVAEDRAYFCCGWQAGTDVDGPRGAWTYDFISHEWNPSTTPPNVALFNSVATGFSVGGKGYTVGFGNYTDDFNKEEVWEFDPTDASWTRKADYPDIVVESGATTRNGHGLVLSWAVDAPSRVYEYFPERDQWVKRQSVTGRTTPLQFFQSVNGTLHYGSGPVWEMSFE